MTYSKPSETFQFPDSVQSDLFNYLKPEQQSFIRPILRILKKPAQEELCCALGDYLETGQRNPPQDFALAAIFNYITQQWSPLHYSDGDSDSNGDGSRYEVIKANDIFEPITVTPTNSVRTCKPIRLGDILRKLFPFKGL